MNDKTTALHKILAARGIAPKPAKPPKKPKPPKKTA